VQSELIDDWQQKEANQSQPEGHPNTTPGKMGQVPIFLQLAFSSTERHLSR